MGDTGEHRMVPRSGTGTDTGHDPSRGRNRHPWDGADTVAIGLMREPIPTFAGANKLASPLCRRGRGCRHRYR